MNFEFVLTKLLEGFSLLRIRYAAIGGFALGALGAERTTKDLDFMVHGEDSGRVHDLMTSLKYARIFHSSDISQYQGEIGAVWGYVDFLRAFRPLALQMLAEAAEHPVLGGKFKLRVLRAEDIIGLKVQAMANSESRRLKDGPDIELLSQLHGKTLDWNRVEKYYNLFNLQAEFMGLKERHGRP